MHCDWFLYKDILFPRNVKHCTCSTRTWIWNARTICEAQNTFFWSIFYQLINYIFTGLLLVCTSVFWGAQLTPISWPFKTSAKGTFTELTNCISIPVSLFISIAWHTAKPIGDTYFSFQSSESCVYWSSLAFKGYVDFFADILGMCPMAISQYLKLRGGIPAATSNAIVFRLHIARILKYWGRQLLKMMMMMMKWNVCVVPVGLPILFFNPTLNIKMVFGEKIPEMVTFSDFVTIFFVKS